MMLEKLVKKFCKSENVLHSVLNSGLVYTGGRIVNRVMYHLSGFSSGESYLDHLCVGVGLGTYFYKKFKGYKGVLAAFGAAMVFNLGWESYEYFAGRQESGLDRFLDVAATSIGPAIAIGMEKIKNYLGVYRQKDL